MPISVNFKVIDDAEFIVGMNIDYPDGHQNGVPFYYIDRRFLQKYRDAVNYINFLGLKKVGYELTQRSDIYVCSRNYYIYKFIEMSCKLYRSAFFFLYEYGRVFQPIPVYEPVSWKYFTPVYCAWRLFLCLRNYTISWRDRLGRRD